MEMTNEEHEEMIENLLDEAVSTVADETALESTKTNDLIVATLPDNSGITLVKREIIYDEKELSQAVDLSSKITRVVGITEDRLKECLVVLLKSNPNTVINSIGYSRENKEITFVADRDLDLEEFYILNSSNVKNEEENNDVINLLNSVTFIEKREKNDNFEKYISIFDFIEILDKITIVTDFIDDIKNKIENHGYPYVKIDDSLLGEKGCLTLLVCANKGATTYFEFKIKDNDLFITNLDDEADISNEILLSFGETLRNLMLNMKLVEQFYKCNETFSGSNFVVINEIKNKTLSISNEFINIKVSFPRKEYKYNALSYKTIQILNSDFKKLLKKIYVCIEECPSFIRKYLTEYKVNGFNESFNAVKLKELLQENQDECQNPNETLSEQQKEYRNLKESLEENQDESLNQKEKKLGSIFRNPFKK